MKRREVLQAGVVGAISVFGTTKFASLLHDWGGLEGAASIHPQLRAVAEALLDQPKAPALTNATLERYRHAMRVGAQMPLPRPTVHRTTVPAERDEAAVPVYVVNMRPGGHRRPAIVHLHGGGFVMGGAAEQIADLQRLALALDCVILSVEYRLAPETNYVGSVNDNLRALRWAQVNAKSLGVDPTRIAIVGISAGGGHAALLALAARNRPEPPPVLQMLIYPMLDDRTGSNGHRLRAVPSLLWSAEHNRYGWRCFLGQEPGSVIVPTDAVPARRDDLHGLAPTFIGVGSSDLFYEEDRCYAARLRAAGVQTQLYVVPGAFHAFDLAAPEAAVSRQFTAAMIQALREAFNT